MPNMSPCVISYSMIFYFRADAWATTCCKKMSSSQKLATIVWNSRPCFNSVIHVPGSHCKLLEMGLYGSTIIDPSLDLDSLTRVCMHCWYLVRAAILILGDARFHQFSTYCSSGNGTLVLAFGVCRKFGTVVSLCSSTDFNRGWLASRWLFQ